MWVWERIVSERVFSERIFSKDRSRGSAGVTWSSLALHIEVTLPAQPLGGILRHANAHGIDPNAIRTLNDLGFILFNITYAVTSVQAIAAGLVGLADKSPLPVFPRWVCCWAIFTGLSFVPLTAMPFFKTGPLAWNGAISFWSLFGI